MHLLGRDQSKYDPRFCQPCERFEHPGGAEIVLTMLFADVRGSTELAERLASRAGAGEILISDATYSAAGLHFENLEYRQMNLKGKSEPIGVRVLRVAPA
jgi:class 3 adenylate cyclase